ncbi:MAG: HAMP domain-containing sensor histidine kinase [Alistipes sp.]
MKLSYKYRRHALLTLVVVLLLGCISQYYIYCYAIHRTTDDVLCEYRTDIEEYVSRTGSLMFFSTVELQHSYLRTTIAPRSHSKVKVREAIYDSLIYNRHEQEFLIYRVLNFPVKTNDQNFIVTLILPTLEQTDLVKAVVISSVVLLLLFALTFYLTRRHLERLVAPLHKLLERMRRYDVRQRQAVVLEMSDIDEFNELNQVLQTMMTKINNDFRALKEMSENTSHELQTPLTILRMKLEQLQQSCVDNEEDMKNIVVMQNVLQRMAKFNAAMLLFTRISSDGFNVRESVQLNDLLDNFVDLHEEIIAAKALCVTKNYRENFAVKLHPMLAQILIDNVMSNAVKYAPQGGYINLDCDALSLTVTNTYNNIIPQGDLFERYNRSRNYDNSNGLGMPIIREICSKNGLAVSADVTAGTFSIRLLNHLSQDTVVA